MTDNVKPLRGGEIPPELAKQIQMQRASQPAAQPTVKRSKLILTEDKHLLNAEWVADWFTAESKGVTRLIAIMGQTGSRRVVTSGSTDYINTMINVLINFMSEPTQVSLAFGSEEDFHKAMQEQRAMIEKRMQMEKEMVGEKASVEDEAQAASESQETCSETSSAEQNCPEGATAETCCGEKGGCTGENAPEVAPAASNE